MNWYGKPYYSLDAWFKNQYGGKVRKIALDGGFTCPNRDGTLDNRGCIFCSQGGSGDFAVAADSLTKTIQDLEDNPPKDRGHFIGYAAYFQAFTNTYAPIEKLRKIYTAALESEKILGISIGTRPDCIDKDVIELLDELKIKYPKKFIWVEMGLQTIHEKSEEYIRRHYPLSVYDAAVEMLKKAEIPYVTHIILGLPGETKEMMLQTVEYVNQKKPFGVKLQLLHVLQHTDLASDYEKGKFKCLSMEEYIDIILECVKRLDKEVVIHRLTGDGDREILIDPMWSVQKMTVLNNIHHEMKVKGVIQGEIN